MRARSVGGMTGTHAPRSETEADRQRVQLPMYVRPDIVRQLKAHLHGLADNPRLDTAVKIEKHRFEDTLNRFMSGNARREVLR